MAKSSMVKVVNESYTTHKIRVDRKIKGPFGEDVKEKVYSVEWVFPKKQGRQPSVVSVPREEFEQMINEDPTLTQVYTKDHWKAREKIVEDRMDKRAQFNAATGKEQVDLAKELVPGPLERYYINNMLPHEA